MTDGYLLDAQNYFGKSSMYIESLKVIRGQQTAQKNIPRDTILREAQVLASCSYETNTKWGTEVSVYIYIHVTTYISPLEFIS